MSRSELDLAIEWAAREGWNPGLHDADAYYATDPDGFFLGLIDEEPVGSISAVAYDDRFGFIGLFIVRPEFRGRGFGGALWNAAMTYLGSRTIGLDGVVAQQRNYEKSGFRIAYRNVRYEGSAVAAPRVGVVDLATIPFAQIEAYDAALFPVRRPSFLRRWISQPGAAALGVLRSGELAGYGVARVCRSGCKIGPLFADSEALAEELFRALAGFAAGPLYLDTPEVNPAAVALARRHDMRPIFETARMYTGAAPALPLDRIFGVTTFELG